MTRASKVLLSERQIKKLLAHREPFLLVHHAIENVIGERVTAVARQNDSLAVPSRLHMLEGLGQTSALLIKQVRLGLSQFGFLLDLMNTKRFVCIVVGFDTDANVRKSIPSSFRSNEKRSLG